MRILWFNWRDIKHPDAGGAEVYTHEVASRLQQKGHDVTLFSADIPNKIREEKIDGIKIIRNGGKFSVYNEAKKYYQMNQNNFDIVIDEINGKPFLTPKFVKDKPIVAVFHQSIKEEWFYETFFPINYLCYFYLEKKWLSYYKNITIITVSHSSKEDLSKSYGLKNVIIAPNGLNIQPLHTLPNKSNTPTIIFLGRMKKHKLPDHAIKAFAIIKSRMPNSKMDVIGDGYLLNKIKKQNKVHDVIFHGKVKNSIKYDLLKNAHIMIMPSVREGWGLVVTEANAMGTPVIAYDVPGLRDSIQHERTGLLTKNNNPESIANLCIDLFNDPNKLQDLSQNALDFSKAFSWDNTADIFDTIIKHKLRNK